MHERWSMPTYQGSDDGHEPDLDVEKRLNDMGHLEAGVDDSGLVAGDMLEQGGLLLFGQEARLHGAVWNDKVGRDAGHASDSAQDDKHGLPAGEIGVLDMLEAERDEAADDLSQAQARVPDAESRRLLGLGVPLAADEHQTGRNGSLEDAQEDASREQGLVVPGSRCAGG